MNAPRLPIPAMALMLAFVPAAFAEEKRRSGEAEKERSFAELKCQRYQKAQAEARSRLGTRGLGEAFVAAHQSFLDSGCLARAEVCPVSPEEFRFANMMVVLGMNHGLSGTFFPFACRKAP
ncbi:MAG: hypothetical protein LCH38_06140 [Proteobacteria bacterium]|nr:hypothetical protein [Pseudomonadota bacterium]